MLSTTLVSPPDGCYISCQACYFHTVISDGLLQKCPTARLGHGSDMNVDDHRWVLCPHEVGNVQRGRRGLSILKLLLRRSLVWPSARYALSSALRSNA